MRTRPLGSASLLPPLHRRIIDATDAQKAEALRLTKAAATTIRDLVRDLDLPASSFDAVLALYANQEWMVVERAEIERENAENLERAGLVTKLRAKNIVSKNAVELGTDYELMGRPIPVGGVRRDPGFTPAMYDGLDGADLDELRELAKNHDIK